MAGRFWCNSRLPMIRTGESGDFSAMGILTSPGTNGERLGDDKAPVRNQEGKVDRNDRGRAVENRQSPGSRKTLARSTPGWTHVRSTRISSLVADFSLGLRPRKASHDDAHYCIG